MAGLPRLGGSTEAAFLGLELPPLEGRALDLLPLELALRGAAPMATGVG